MNVWARAWRSVDTTTTKPSLICTVLSGCDALTACLDTHKMHITKDKWLGMHDNMTHDNMTHDNMTHDNITHDNITHDDLCQNDQRLKHAVWVSVCQEGVGLSGCVCISRGVPASIVCPVHSLLLPFYPDSPHKGTHA